MALLPAVVLLQGVGAVASRRAAELYGLDILDEDIQDAKDNVTRFIKLARWVLLCTAGWPANRVAKTPQAGKHCNQRKASGVTLSKQCLVCF